MFVCVNYIQSKSMQSFKMGASLLCHTYCIENGMKFCNHFLCSLTKMRPRDTVTKVLYLFRVWSDTNGGRGGGGATRQPLVQFLGEKGHERRYEEKSSLQACVPISGVVGSRTPALYTTNFHSSFLMLPLSRRGGPPP